MLWDGKEMSRKILLNKLDNDVNMVLYEDRKTGRKYLHFPDLLSEERFTIEVGPVGVKALHGGYRG